MFRVNLVLRVGATGLGFRVSKDQFWRGWSSLKKTCSESKIKWLICERNPEIPVSRSSRPGVSASLGKIWSNQGEFWIHHFPYHYLQKGRMYVGGAFVMCRICMRCLHEWISCMRPS